ncbi:hypothetical protein LIER_07297 [Lithospermum erythrorhizon]|uniref:Transposase n=1 Tax=Lithospermum erythrorhizon TaxID=34254 RepID=A0AAV3P9A1_LITER
MLAQSYSVSTKTVSKIWSKAKLFIANGNMVELSSNLVKGVSRKRIQVDLEKVKEIPLRFRKSIMDLSIALGISKSTLHRRIKEGALRRHSNAIKPQLTEENKRARLCFCMSMLEVRSLTNSSTLSTTFLEMYDRVEPAKRNSKNRAAGTLVTKSIFSITQDVIRSYLLEKVVPTIKDKWPCCSRTSTIYIQQDNARPHIDPLDDKLLAVAQGDGFDIRLTFQHPNSPDLNVLDLGYFRAIQSLQYREDLKTRRACSRCDQIFRRAIANLSKSCFLNFSRMHD